MGVEKDEAWIYHAIISDKLFKVALKENVEERNITFSQLNADQLINTIKKMNEQVKDSMSLDEMKEVAEFFLANNQPKKSDYAKRYEDVIVAIEKQDIVASSITSNEDSLARENIVKKLKEFRLQQSRKENLKPYMVFNDAQMNDLIDKNPQNKDELIKVSGFGAVKVEKYGEMILRILKE